MIVLSINLWIIFSFIFLEYSHCQDLSADIEKLANSLELAFNNLKLVMNPVELSKKISNINKEPLNEESIKEILTKSKLDTEKIVKKTNNVVDNIQTTLTQAYYNYSLTPPKHYSIECSNESFIYYYRAKCIKNGIVPELNCSVQTLPFDKDPYLDNFMTNRQNATTHVPTNVFDAGRDIQVVANWTGNLDQTFSNKQDDPQLKWQFFCSSTGFFKIYPGIRWHIQIEDSEKDSTIVDFFDCRSEQWYLEATAYPKKMIIMVDKSGSMKGRRKIIANHTVYEILNTLTENDFFNILLLGRKFTKEYTFADNSTNGILMHATDKNKKFLLDQLGSVFIPDGIAEYDIGLRVSFNILRNDKENKSSTDLYNYLLMIITDGSPLAYQELIEENNKNVGARIFTYLIGQGATERDMVKSMACRNKGFFVEIATLADVKENVQKYLNVIARKNALVRDAFTVWTGVHQMQMQPAEDSTPSNVSVTYTSPNFSPTPIGITFASNLTETTLSQTTTSSINTSLPSIPTHQTKIEIFKDKPIKLFVSASKAAYDETNATEQMNNGILLGAAGVDVPIIEFIKTAPFWKIGLHAYLFGITSNGFVLFHPKFRPQYKKFIKYFYRNVDISELEIDSSMNISYIRNDHVVPDKDTFQLRKKMLDQSPSSPILYVGRQSTYEIIDDFKTAFSIERDYYAVGIDKTSYKFGLAVPVNQKVPKYTNKDFTTINNNTFATDFSMDYEKFKEQCSTIFTGKDESGLTMKNYEFCYMNQYIAALQIISPMCALIDVLTNDTTRKACISDDLDKSSYINNLHSEIQMSADFPTQWKKIDGLNSSVQQIFSMHHFGLIRYHNYDTLSYEHFITNHSLGLDDSLYQETILVAQHMNYSNILVARPLPNEVLKQNIAPSSLIFTVTTPLLNNNAFVGIVGVQAKYDYFDSILRNSTACILKENRECYLITESAVILSNNQNNRNNGNMLREADCSLMESLIVNKIFAEQYLYDFQGLCITPKRQVDSFSTRLIDPFTQIFRFTLWFIYELFIFIQNFSLTSIMWSLTSQEDNYDAAANMLKKSLDINVFSTDSSTSKSLDNLYYSATKSNKNAQDKKSKRQHEMELKSQLIGEIKRCDKDNQGNKNEWTGCIQKAVSNICRQDKSHVSQPTDPHVDKLTTINTISHCVTACSFLHSEYPKEWQEQDECKQPLKLCHTVLQTYTSILQSSPMIPIPQTTTIPTVETFLQSRNRIVEDDNMNDMREETPVSNQMKSEMLCSHYCPAKKWYVRPIRGTNLLLVVLDKPNAACSCDCSNSFGKTIELTRIVNDSIQNPYMVKPSYYPNSVDFNKTENSSYCTDSAPRSCLPLYSFIVISLLLPVILP